MSNEQYSSNTGGAHGGSWAHMPIRSEVSVDPADASIVLGDNYPETMASHATGNGNYVSARVIKWGSETVIGLRRTDSNNGKEAGEA